MKQSEEEAEGEGKKGRRQVRVKWKRASKAQVESKRKQAGVVEVLITRQSPGQSSPVRVADA